jgi:hypothetical protein
VIIFLFAIYASCCGKKGARSLLGVFYLIYALALLALGITVISIKRNKLLDWGARLWSDSNFHEAAQEIEKSLDCKCWNETLCINSSELPADDNHTCSKKLDDELDKYWKPLAYVILAFAAVMLLGMVVAFIYGCKEEKPNDKKEGILYGGF